jgi:hypothetical protein
MEPGAETQLPGGLPVFGSYLCQTAGDTPQVPQAGPLLPAQLQKLIQDFVFTADGPSAPPCREQAPLGRFAEPAQPGKYPQLKQLPPPSGAGG